MDTAFESQYCASLDVGGTHCRLGLLEITGSHAARVVAQKKFPIVHDFDSGIPTIINHVKEMATNHKLSGVGGSFPGVIDTSSGTITLSANLPEWQGKPIREELQARLQVPVKLCNDVVAAAAGEATYGRGADAGKFVFIIWGTGFGGAKVERLLGRLHITHFEPGHYIADRNGSVCPCGQIGCPELEIGGGSLSRRLGKGLDQISDDDPLWESVATLGGDTITNIIIFHPVPLLIFGGGLVLKRPFLLEKIDAAVQTRLRVFSKPELVLSSLGDDAALYGAAALLRTELL